MAKRSALVADSFSADVRPGLVASLRIIREVLLKFIFGPAFHVGLPSISL